MLSQLGKKFDWYFDEWKVATGFGGRQNCFSGRKSSFANFGTSVHFVCIAEKVSTNAIIEGYFEGRKPLVETLIDKATLVASSIWICLARYSKQICTYQRFLRMEFPFRKSNWKIGLSYCIFQIRYVDWDFYWVFVLYCFGEVWVWVGREINTVCTDLLNPSMKVLMEEVTSETLLFQNVLQLENCHLRL